MQVSVANVRVPELPSQLPAVLKAASKDDPDTAAIACGYLTLYTRLFASIAGAPLLHEPGFMGAHSSLWHPDTFWKRDSWPPGQRWHLSGSLPQGASWTTAATHALDSQQTDKCASSHNVSLH